MMNRCDFFFVNYSFLWRPGRGGSRVSQVTHATRVKIAGILSSL